MICEFFFAILLIGIQCFSDASGDNNLRAVALLFRHGDRSPLGTFPNDPHSNYSWPGGYGAISPKGIQQLYTAGHLKGKRYAQLFANTRNNLLDTSNIYLQSSSTQRCVDSAIAFLEGFLPTKWPASLVNVLPGNEDKILAIYPGKTCPKYDATLNSVFSVYDPEIQQLVGDEDAFIDFLVNSTGLNATTLRGFFYISDSFKVQLDNGLELPNWAEPIYESHLKPLGGVIFNKWGHTARMQVRSGALLKDIVNRLDEYNQGGAHNILLYSGHDLTISSLMIHLDIIEQAVIQPDYGATLAFELYENEMLNDYEVKVFYFRNYSDEDPIRISIYECEEPCSFATFKTSMDPKFTKNYEEVCKI